MSLWVCAYPAFIGWFIGELIAGIGGDADFVGRIAQRRVHQEHAEDNHIACLKRCRRPAATEFLNNFDWVIAEMSRD